MNTVDRRERDDENDRKSVHRKARARRALKFGYWKQSIERLKENGPRLRRKLSAPSQRRK